MSSHPTRTTRTLSATGIGILLVMSISLSLQDASAVTKIEEKIDVRGRAIPLVLPPPIGSITAYHLFIIHTDKKGQESICQGFPFDPLTGQVPPDSALFPESEAFLTQGQCIPYLPSNRDFIPGAPSITIVSGHDAKKAFECLTETTETFNDANIPYRVVSGPNSNSYTRTVLDECALPALKPAIAVIAPGWEISIDLEVSDE